MSEAPGIHESPEPQRGLTLAITVCLLSGFGILIAIVAGLVACQLVLRD